MSAALVIAGDPHGEWRPLLEAIAEDARAAIVILGDCDLVRPLHVELASVFAAGAEVAYLYGNHEKELPEFWDNLVGGHPGGLLHATIRRVDPPTRSRASPECSSSGPGSRATLRDPGRLPPDARPPRAVAGRPAAAATGRDLPGGFRALAGKQADILVVHEAPSSHGHGFRALDDLARNLRARLVVHGHHHTSSTGTTADGIAVIGLANAEVLRLQPRDL